MLTFLVIMFLIYISRDKSTMTNFYNFQIDTETEIESNKWYELNNLHYFKLPVSFQEYTFGTTIRFQHFTSNNLNSTQNGFFFPDSNFDTHFLTDFSNHTMELITQIFNGNDSIYTEQIVEDYFSYKIPWYYIPKNFLDYQPKHLIMMFNMGYLMQNNPNNNQTNNLYYNKYYHGIEISQTDIENSYVEFMTHTFSMERIIVQDYLNL